MGKTIKLKQRQRQTTKRKPKPVLPAPPPQTELGLGLPKGPPPEPEIPALGDPIWTENKAKLIERYLFYFVMITKHGTYIDGFAGPQKRDKPNMWAAKLVLESEPRWFRHFYLFDKGQKQIESLERLKASQPTEDPARQIEITHGDFNVKIKHLLEGRPIREREACFCLLDQRTFECEWETLRVLARYKSSGNKIELFYFLPMHWFGRARAALVNKAPIELWWGRDDWKSLSTDGNQRKELIVRRFKEELGYHSVKPWPIFERKDGGAVMYYMIHATDHPLAPGLMARAYKKWAAAGLVDTPLR
jgi:three-Cys-motif partner protein